MKKQYPEEFLEKLQSVKGKRPRTVIDLILKNGYVTTEDLALAGYEHAPRAVRDVRELGIPIITERTKGSTGKSIAVYKFGNPNSVADIASKKAGRTANLNKIKHQLLEKYGSKCAIYLENVPANELQVDHRIPFEIAGEQDINNMDLFMLLSPSANRRKSWACEHCDNWICKSISMCQSCFWAYPDKYTHVAGKNERLIILHLMGEESDLYDEIISEYGKENIDSMVKEKMLDYFIKKR